MFLSLGFWIFVCLVLGIYNMTRGKAQNIVLLVASYVLYAYFDWQFLALLILATTLTFVVALQLDPKNPHRRAIFYVGVLINLGILALFKYSGFFLESFARLLTGLGLKSVPTSFSILLPLGISFYSFRLLSYLFDVNKGRLVASKSWVDIAVYVAFFPQIASGPIERASRFLSTLQSTRRLNQTQFVDGLTLIFLGLFYRVAIADPAASVTDSIFTNLSHLSPGDALVAFLLFGVRIYADFAGYSAMAIGVSTWFGLPAMENFRQPYFSQGIIEFWTRWHISLSTWLRDYLFYPLSRSLLRRWGNQRSLQVQFVAYFTTMLVTGIWHGANWTFIIWGMLHGVLILFERLTKAHQPTSSDAQNSLLHWAKVLRNIIITNLVLACTWVFFSAPVLSSAVTFFQRLVSGLPVPTILGLSKLLPPIGIMVLTDLLLIWLKDVRVFWRLSLPIRVSILLAAIFMILVFGGAINEPFIYFKF